MGSESTAVKNIEAQTIVVWLPLQSPLFLRYTREDLREIPKRAIIDPLSVSASTFFSLTESYISLHSPGARHRLMVDVFETTNGPETLRCEKRSHRPLHLFVRS